MQSTAKTKASVYLRKQTIFFIYFIIIIRRRLTSICVLSGSSKISFSSIATKANRIRTVEPKWFERMETGDQGQEFIFSENYYVCQQIQLNETKSNIITVKLIKKQGKNYEKTLWNTSKFRTIGLKTKVMSIFY